MGYLFLVFVFALVTILQTSLYKPISWNGIKPDFFLLVIIYLNLFPSDYRGDWSGFGAGLIEDILSGGPLGSATLSKTLSAYGAFLMGKQVVLDNPFVQLVIVFIVSLLEGFIRFLVLDYLRFVDIGISVFPEIILPQAFITTLTALPFFWLLGYGQRRFLKV